MQTSVPSQQQVELTLYETDFDLWISDTVAKLKSRDFDHLDLENLIDEVESLSKRDRRELESRLTNLLEHLLKRSRVDMPECYNGWTITIYRIQSELEKILRDSPSLRAFGNDLISSCYLKALRIVREEYPYVNFSESCPFPQEIDRLIKEDFLPETNFSVIKKNN